MIIHAFTKTYGKRIVLDLPEMELQEGQIAAVIGPNGSGKSTLARILAGIEPADGRKNVLREISVGYMPQKSFSFRMSTEKNILLNGNDPSRAKDLMKALGIDTLANQNAKKLSGGETARMALCRILMNRYDLLILDEPTAAMDMESTLIAEGLICRICAEQGCAIMLITHSISQARRIADRAIFLHQGELIEQGECAQVLSEPKQDQTRRFLEFYGS